MTATRIELQSAIEKFSHKKKSSGDVIINSDEQTQSEWLFDFRALLLQSRWLDYYADLFWEECGDRFPFQVCGMETAAISLVSAVMMKGRERGVEVNGLYIRKSRKRQGMLKQIEGTPTSDPVILVDDLINRGGTFFKQVLVLQDAGLSVVGCFTLLRFRELEQYVKLTEQSISITSIFTLNDFGLKSLVDKPYVIPQPQFEVVWRFNAPNPSFNLVLQKSAPLLDNDKIYFGSDAGIFYCLSQTSGEVVWTYVVKNFPFGKGILSTPVIYKDSVYFGAYNGSVYALNKSTGKKVWSYDDADWVGSSPALAVEKGLLYIGLEFGLWKRRGGIVALHITTGKKAWEQFHAGLTHASPHYIAEENMVVIGSNDENIYAYDADSGKLLWREAVPGAVKSSFAYSKEERGIYFGTIGGGRFYALSAVDGRVLFTKECKAMYSTPCVVGNVVYFSCLDKNIYAYNIKNWQQVWTFSTSGRVFASPLVAHASLWIGSNDGRLYELDVATGLQKTFFQFSERIVNRIAINEAGNRLFVGTQANEMYCLKRV